MAGKVIIDGERCKGCGLCIAVCSSGNILIRRHSNKTGYFPAEASSAHCTGCGMCAIICPDAAIEVLCEDVERIRTIAQPAAETRRNRPQKVTNNP